MPRISSYSIDLNVREGHEGYTSIVSKCPMPIGMKNLQQTELTIKSQQSSNSTNNNNNSTRLGPTLTIAQQNAITAKRNKMAMSIGLSPGQALAMNALMLWFSGSQLNVFSISTTTSAIVTPLTNLINTELTFRQFASTSTTASTVGPGGAVVDTNGVDVQMPKLLYVLLNLLWLGIGLYKMSSMRLLPTTSADWTYKLSWKEMMETTSIPPDNSFY